ncbi:MAG TPA: NADH-ubiquinone oxidoreductase-F iron-sulfur binding region domain-containing protein, partial [Anaerolineae bacterium]|nr:NADH-ubiquinone oxidoreductase-F iron-sulfur binding region domain-containing protein [Anaerolineae bacterium]
SCGKCVPCRVGTVELYRILERVTAGTATRVDLQIMEDLCVLMRETSLCGLGQSAPNPLLSTLHYFRDEYEALVQETLEPTSARFVLPKKPLESSPEVPA